MTNSHIKNFHLGIFSSIFHQHGWTTTEYSDWDLKICFNRPLDSIHWLNSVKGQALEAKVGLSSQISNSHSLSLNRLRVKAEIIEVQRKLKEGHDFSEASMSSDEIRLAALVIAHAILNPCKFNISSSLLSKAYQ